MDETEGLKNDFIAAWAFNRRRGVRFFGTAAAGRRV
jgi:hypothetical protein